jgi:hypothetical protein
MDKKKLLIYGGVGAAGLFGLYLLTRNGSAAPTGVDTSGVLPAVLYTGNGTIAGMAPGTTTPVVDTGVAGGTVNAADTIQGALDLAFAQLGVQASNHVNDNATALFASLPSILGNLGGGQVVGNSYTHDGQTYLNLTTSLFNASNNPAPSQPALPLPVALPVSPPMLSTFSCNGDWFAMSQQAPGACGRVFDQGGRDPTAGGT